MKLCIILLTLFAGILVISADGNVLAEPGSVPSGTVAQKSATENIQKSEDARNRSAAGVSQVGSGTESLKDSSHRNEVLALRELLRVQADKYEKRIADLETAYQAELTELEDENKQLKTELAKVRRALTDAEKKLQLEVEMGLEAGDVNGLRRKLLETIEKSSVNLEKLKMLEMSAASVIDTLEPAAVTAQEQNLIWTLDLVLRTGMSLAGQSAVMADLLMQKLPGMSMDEVERAKIRIGLEDLRKKSASFAKLGVSPGEPAGFESCRILEINEKLGVAILSAGYRNGVRVNLTLTAENGRRTPLRVIAIRSFVSAAIPENGELQELAPGMVLKACRQSKE